jgi:hypothetical protein
LSALTESPTTENTIKLGSKAGQHARTVLSVAELPNGIPVEINGEFELWKPQA